MAARKQTEKERGGQENSLRPLARPHLPTAFSYSNYQWVNPLKNTAHNPITFQTHESFAGHFK